MGLEPPTDAELRDLADHLYFDLTDREVRMFRDEIGEWLEAYRTIAKYEPDRLPVRYPRTGGYRESPDENPLNAWITRCDIAGADGGPLAGWNVAVKDNIAVAGIEMTCGTACLEGYVPSSDATVVTRLLDAGGRIVGKTNMDAMAYSGIGDTSAFGPTLNPHDHERLAGGSSGGSAIAVATGQADVALGTDQGGSIRAPASWSGVVGHKPTHGLVPYTGCIGTERTVDHVGPLAPDVRTAARTLGVLAGADGHDPRQPDIVPAEEYEANLDAGVQDLSIAVLEQGFDRPESEAVVNEAVQGTIDSLADRGATVEEVSVPIHADAYDISVVSGAVGWLASFRGEGIGHDWLGWYDVDWVEAFGRARRDDARGFPAGVKCSTLFGAYVADRYPGYYAEAMNLRRTLREGYDELLGDFDCIAMPTTPQRAAKYEPDGEQGTVPDMGSNLSNTCAADLTGHPALSVPVDSADGLPVGLMVTGSHFDDGTVLRTGYAVERGRE